MAGAGSIIAANYMYNAAPKDGTVIGNISGQIILEQLFANPAVQYDLGKFRYLGVPIGETYLLLVTRKPGVTKFDELVGAKSKQIVVGGIPGSTVEQGPILLRDSVGREHQSCQRIQRHRRYPLGHRGRRTGWVSE